MYLVIQSLWSCIIVCIFPPSSSSSASSFSFSSSSYFASSLYTSNEQVINETFYLQVGDRVGVIRKDNGNLIFYVNSVEQGLAASNVPERIFGVVDLYGQAAQASIVQHSEHCSSDVLPSSLSSSTIYRLVFRTKFVCFKKMAVCKEKNMWNTYDFGKCRCFWQVWDMDYEIIYI